MKIGICAACGSVGTQSCAVCGATVCIKCRLASGCKVCDGKKKV